MRLTGLNGLTNVQTAFDKAKGLQDDAYAIYDAMDDYKDYETLRHMKLSDLRLLANKTRRCKMALEALIEADGELATALQDAHADLDEREQQLHNDLGGIQDGHTHDKNEIADYLALVAGVLQAIVSAYRGAQGAQGTEHEPDISDINDLSDRDDLSNAEVTETETVLHDMV
jgi:hypothetical protein